MNAKTYICVMAVLAAGTMQAQRHTHFDDIQPDREFDNILVKSMDSDERTSTFIIWVKQDVKAHYHEHHSEVVAVLEGSGRMTLGNDTFLISAGDYIFIPPKTAHSVVNLGEKWIKVMSVQAPKFDGSDRIFVENR